MCNWRGFYGGEGGIRTPDSLATMADFESAAFNRALPPLRLVSRSVQMASAATHPVALLYQSTMPQNARQTFGLISPSKVRHIHTIQCFTFPDLISLTRGST
jgi:hypothetical protein